MDRLPFVLRRLWWQPSPRNVLPVTMAARSPGLVAAERLAGWPDWLRTERVPMPRLPHP